MSQSITETRSLEDQFFDYVASFNFPTRIVLVGSGCVPFSELGIHVRLAGKTIAYGAVFLDHEGRLRYAAVLTVDGQRTHGLPREVLGDELVRWTGRGYELTVPFTLNTIPPPVR